MMNARHLLSNLCHYSGANAVVTKQQRDSLLTLCYHRVLDAGDPVRGSVDPALVTSSHVFERQMDTLAERFTPITLSQMLDWLDGHGRLPQRATLITFDDGVADTYTNAFPVMRRLGIPATVFLATGFIGTRERYWTDEVHEYVAARSGAEIASQEVERLKAMPSDRRAGEICEIFGAYDPDSPAGGLQSFERSCSADPPNLTWPQVEEMAECGFEFGSHTRNHVILPHESDDFIHEELKACADDIRLRLGRMPTAFAYPDGQYDERVAELVQEDGCQCAFTCDEGIAQRETDPLALPRLLMHDGVSATPDGDFSRAMFLTYLAGTIPWRYKRTVR